MAYCCRFLVLCKIDPSGVEMATEALVFNQIIRVESKRKGLNFSATTSTNVIIRWGQLRSICGPRQIRARLIGLGRVFAVVISIKRVSVQTRIEFSHWAHGAYFVQRSPITDELANATWRHKEGIYLQKTTLWVQGEQFLLRILLLAAFNDESRRRGGGGGIAVELD